MSKKDIRIQIVPEKEITEVQLEQLWSVYQRSYTVAKEEFLSKKATIDIYAIYSLNNEIIGFTGIRYRTLEVEKKKYKGLYIGQTAILSEFRGKSIMQRTVTKMLLRHLKQSPFQKLIIWSNALTYRPYLVMAKGLKYYYPHPSEAPDHRRKAIQNAIGKAYYQDAYDDQTGIVRKNENIMQEHEINYSPEELADRHISFYLKQNPFVKEGYGLICYADGTISNLVHYLSRKSLKRARKN